MVVVVGPAQAEPVLPVLLDARGGVARLPVLALGLEDEMAGQVGRTRELDDSLQSVLGRGEPFGVVIEATPARPPEVERRQGVAGGVRLHPAVPGQLAGERFESQITAPLDDRQRRPFARNPSDSVGTHRIPDDLQPQVVGAGERRHRIHLDRDFSHAGWYSVRVARAADGQRDPGEDPARMGEDRHADPIGIRLAFITQGPEPSRQARPAGDHQVIDPDREPRPGLARQAVGQHAREAIPLQGYRDQLVDECLGLWPSLPFPFQRGGLGRRRHQRHGDSPVLRLEVGRGSGFPARPM